MPAPHCIYCHVVIFSEGGVGGKSSLKSECTLKHKRDITTFDELHTGSLESCNARMSKHGKSGSEFCQISPFCWKKNPSAVVPSGVSVFSLSKGLLFVEVTEVSKIIIWCFFFHYSVIYSYIKSKTKTLKQTFLHIELLTE